MEITILNYGILNKMGRVYPKEAVLKMIEKQKEEGQIFGEIGKGEELPSIINLSKISHSITKLRLDEKNKKLMGEIEILDTPMGKLLKRGDIREFNIEPRGIGTINEKTKEVENYELISFDIIIGDKLI